MEFEGIFNGKHMLTADGREFPIPANYISKSKLLEGDGMMLYMNDGRMLYKQVKPVERNFGIGTAVEVDEIIMIRMGDDIYEVPNASISFFGIEPGDEVMIVTPKEKKSNYAAVEGVISKMKM